MIFGENKRPATARGSGDVYVFTLDQAELLRRVHTDSSPAYTLLKRMADRIDALEGSLVRMATRALPEAMAPAPSGAQFVM